MSQQQRRGRYIKVEDGRERDTTGHMRAVTLRGRGMVRDTSAEMQAVRVQGGRIGPAVVVSRRGLLKTFAVAGLGLGGGMLVNELLKGGNNVGALAVDPSSPVGQGVNAPQTATTQKTPRRGSLPESPFVTKGVFTKNFFPNREDDNGRIWRPRYVIIHGTAAGEVAANTATYYVTTESYPLEKRVSTHYVVGRWTKEVVQCVSEWDGAWGNGVLTEGHASFWDESVNPNLTTISIELCKPSPDDSDEVTAIQREMTFKLIRDICQRWQIPMRKADGRGGISGHFSIDPLFRSHCPGPFPWNDLFQFLNA